MKRWAPWVALLLVVVVALVAGTRDGDGPEPVSHRVDRIAHGVRCPTCRELSAAESDAAAAKAVRLAIRRDVEAGRTDGEIRAALADRYGRDILLTPAASGVVGLVWVLPVVGVVIAIGLLVLAFRRWRPVGRHPTDDDRALVERALTE
ncbi:MAG TPA: cytochrome c-type biogenesis protein CcmH [Acidimicrobiales bacterium]|nr:cytochrome c-type biogenesis protein CcmH [Acidimicrobiales bacterium]